MALVMDRAGSAAGAHLGKGPLGSAQDRASLLDPGATHPGLAITADSEGTRTAMAVNQALAYAAWVRPPVRCRAATTPRFPATPQQTGVNPMSVPAWVAFARRLAAVLAILGGATFESGQSAKA